MVGRDGLAPPMSEDSGFTARPITTSGHHPFINWLRWVELHHRSPAYETGKLLLLHTATKRYPQLYSSIHSVNKVQVVNSTVSIFTITNLRSRRINVRSGEGLV